MNTRILNCIFKIYIDINFSCLSQNYKIIRGISRLPRYSTVPVVQVGNCYFLYFIEVN